MSELFPSDVQLNNLSGTSDVEQEVPYIAVGQTPYYTNFYKMLYRLLDMARRAGDLRVYKDGDLTFGVRSGKFADGDSIVNFAGASTVALVDNAVNYIYLLSDGALTVSATSFPLPSQTPHLRLASIQVSSGQYAHSDISDCRGAAIMNILDGMDSSIARATAEVFGQTEFDAQRAGQLIGGDNADALHSHSLQNVADGGGRFAVSADQAAALGGTNGTPDGDNCFVTNSDQRLSDSRNPDFSAFGAAAQMQDSDSFPMMRGSQGMMVSGDEVMAASKYANGSGKDNPNAIDCAGYALAAGAADNAFAVDGYSVSSMAQIDVVVATRSDMPKISADFLNVIGDGANVTATTNSSGAMVIAFGTNAVTKSVYDTGAGSSNANKIDHSRYADNANSAVTSYSLAVYNSDDSFSRWSSAYLAPKISGDKRTLVACGEDGKIHPDFLPADVEARFRQIESNVALSHLRILSQTALSGPQSMSGGIVDEFETTAGLQTSSGAYFTTSDAGYLSNYTGASIVAMDLLSTTQAASVAPTSASISLVYKNVGTNSVIPGTDLAAQVICNGGTSGTSFVFGTQAVNLGGGYSLAYGDTTMPGNTGTSMGYRIQSAGSKPVDVHGVNVNWRK